MILPWGAPQRGLYGPLNFANLDEVDLIAEMTAMCVAMNVPVRQEFVEIAAETMLADLLVQRGYRAEVLPTTPVSVIAWSADQVVAAEDVWPGWTERMDASFHLARR